MNNIVIRNILSPIWLIFTGLFVYSPIAIMLLFSFNNSETYSSWNGFTSIWYKQLFTSTEMITALLSSLLVAVTSTFLAVTLSLFLVVANRWWSPWWLIRMFFINISIPEIFLAVAVLNIFVFLKISTGYLSLVVGHTLLGIGYAIPLLHAAILDVDKALIDSSFDLGATHMQTFRFVLFPILKPVVIAASFLVFTLSLDDFFINFFCSGVEFSTASTYVYTTIRSYVDPSLNALSSTLFFLSLILVLIVPASKSISKVLRDED